MKPHAVVLACLAALAAACSDTGPQGAVPGELTAQRREWNRLGIANYSYNLHQICFCAIFPRDAIVQVRNRQVVSVRDRETGALVDPARWNLYYSIDGLFDMLEEALVNGAAKLEVKYHPTRFYPVEVDLDRIANAVDDELLVLAGDLDPEF